MTDNSTTSFSKLDDLNYTSWAIMMEAELIRKDLWTNVVEEIKIEVDVQKAKRKAEKMAQARAEMILRVEPGQLSHMTLKDPLEIWEKLRNVHRG
ncbi:hypothetical protein F5878DRAFT_549112 [Lentinula raphanica]|uniref:DUF4219 domain-containing protein n=1 Tax=Lentinula raphanica TaxID=153919 RepID=A0AA38NW84_9AGAR|nr:hypothetical protein F5878DRAFT_549112 [Lentinula raphanica]